MAMSEFIRNLDVSLKLFLLLRVLILHLLHKRSKTVPAGKENKNRLLFLLITGTQATTDSESRENNAYAELTSEARDIKVNQPVEFVPVTEVVDRGIIKFS
jgi:cell division protein FtsZ